MSQENVEVVRRIWAALNEDPPRVLVDLFDEEAEIRNPSEFPFKDRSTATKEYAYGPERSGRSSTESTTRWKKSSTWAMARP